MIYVLWGNGERPVAASGNIFSLPLPRKSDTITLEESLGDIQQETETTELEPESEAPTQQVKACHCKNYLLYQ